MHMKVFRNVAPFARTALCAALVLAAPAIATAQGAAALPSAADLVAKHVKAIGGKDAVMKIKSLSVTGTVDVPAAGASAPIEIVRAQNKMRQKMSIPGLGEVLQGFDGTTGWVINPTQGPSVLSGGALDELKLTADLYAELLADQSKNKSVETVEKTEFQGEPAYRVKVIRANGVEGSEFFSVQSGLKLGSRGTMDTQMGPIEMVAELSDYKPVNGVLIPMKTRQKAGPQEFVVSFKSITANDVPDSVFALPDAIKALVAGK
jgi:hypothetical protein